VSAGQEVNEDGKALRDEIARGLHDRYCTGGRGLPPNEGDRAEADAVMPIVQRIIAERDLATRIAASLERECSVRDGALEQIAALIQEIHDWDHTDVDAHNFPDYARGMNRMLDDVHERTGMALRALDSLQRRLDPFRDDEAQRVETEGSNDSE
jgi:hypothetical protein